MRNHLTRDFKVISYFLIEVGVSFHIQQHVHLLSLLFAYLLLLHRCYFCEYFLIREKVNFYDTFGIVFGQYEE
jgi:hypothetical protein